MRAPLSVRQAAMRTRQVEKSRCGWPLGKKRNKPEVSASELRFVLFRLLNGGFSPEKAAALVRERYGAGPNARLVRRWRDSAYCDPTLLESCPPS